MEKPTKKLDIRPEGKTLPVLLFITLKRDVRKRTDVYNMHRQTNRTLRLLLLE